MADYIEYTIYDKQDHCPIAIAYALDGSWAVENREEGITQYFDFIGDATLESVFERVKHYIEWHFPKKYCYMRRTA